MSREPTLIIQGIVAVLIAAQSAAVPMPAWAHTAIGVATVALGAVVNRQAVAPASGPTPSTEGKA